MFKTLINFRDLGGIPTENGKRIKSKKILRSAEIVDLCNDDRELLINDYNLKTIIDFRSQDEVEDRPDDKFEGVKYYNIDVLENLKNSKIIKNSKRNLENIKSVKEVMELMTSVYETLVTDENSSAGYRKFLDEFLMLNEGSLIFHCFAGKDRTGIAAAIILTLLGVKEDDIFVDYMLTNKLRAKNIGEKTAILKDQGKSQEFIECYKTAMSVEESYLRHAYDTAKNKNGSFYNHVATILNISDNEIDKLREMYTE